MIDLIQLIKLINYSRFKPLWVSSLKEFRVRSNTLTSKQTMQKQGKKNPPNKTAI